MSCCTISTLGEIESMDNNKIEELKKITSDHEKRISKLEEILKFTSNKPPINSEEIVSGLIDSGFFDTPKKYGEMIKELKTLAKFNKNHNYRNILSNLTRNDKLERKIAHHQWVYIKK